MIVQESDLVVGKWYIVKATGQDCYQAISPAFDTFLKAYRGTADSPGEYPDDACVRRWDGRSWSAIPWEE